MTFIDIEVNTNRMDSQPRPRSPSYRCSACGLINHPDHRIGVGAGYGLRREVDISLCSRQLSRYVSERITIYQQRLPQTGQSLTLSYPSIYLQAARLFYTPTITCNKS